MNAINLKNAYVSEYIDSHLESESEITSTAIVVYRHLKRLASKTSYVIKVAYGELAYNLSLSKRVIIRCINQLVKAQYLSKYYNFDNRKMQVENTFFFTAPDKIKDKINNLLDRMKETRRRINVEVLKQGGGDKNVTHKIIQDKRYRSYSNNTNGSNITSESNEQKEDSNVTKDNVFNFEDQKIDRSKLPHETKKQIEEAEEQIKLAEADMKEEEFLWSISKKPMDKYDSIRKIGELDAFINHLKGKIGSLEKTQQSKEKQPSLARKYKDMNQYRQEMGRILNPGQINYITGNLKNIGYSEQEVEIRTTNIIYSVRMGSLSKNSLEHSIASAVKLEKQGRFKLDSGFTRLLDKIIPWRK